jgi:hypothetical protein
VLENKFSSSLSGDTGDVNFDFGHVETQFRVLSKPLAHLNQHLEGRLESGIDVQIVGETNPACTTMAGEYSTHDGVLRQTITHHLEAIPLLTASCAFDVMRAPAVIRVTVVGAGAVLGVEVSKERTQFFNGGDVITRLHRPIIIWLCSLARERVKGGLSAHFLKGRLDVGVEKVTGSSGHRQGILRGGGFVR